MKAKLAFYLWDGTVISFSSDSGPFSVAIDGGIVFVKQHSVETGIPISSIKYSEEQKEEPANG